MAACSIFDEDEVCVPTSSGGFKYGLVVESSEYISSDEDDDVEVENRVQKGQIKVAWHPSGDETVVSEKKVILTDRSLMPGDVVRRLISGKASQRGFVQTCTIKCHAKILGTEQYIYNIDAKYIKPIQEFDPEPEVTLDSWVGHVIEVNEEITVRFPCGARCKLSNAGMLNLEDVHDKRPNHSEFVMRNFYPGQELTGFHEDYEDATWIQTSNIRGPKCKVKSLFSATVVVEEVKTKSVDVNWVCQGFTHTGAGTDKLKSPANLVEGDDLKRLRRLDCFEYCHLQIGDKGYYVVKESDTLLHKISPRKHVTPDIIELQTKENVIVLGTSADGIHVKQRGTEKKNIEKEMNAKNKANGVEAAKGHGSSNETNKESDVDNKENVCDDKGTAADDEFEDLEDDGSDSGSDADSVKSDHESPVPRKKNRKRSSALGHGFRRGRGKRAKKKARHIEREVKPGDRVPIEIWYTFASCTVMWQDGKVEDNIPSPELFPIHHLDELEFFPGDFVLDSKGSTSTGYGVIVSSDHKERTVMVKWVQPYSPGQSTKPEEKEPVELSVFDIKDHPDYKFRCGHTVIRVGGYEGNTALEAVGQVYRLDPEGTIQVWWPNGTITSCFPQELYLIGEEFQSESGSESEWTDDEEEEEEEEESDVSWETENEETTTDTETDAKKNKAKLLWTVSDSKKKELDALLDRAQAAVSGLLNIFTNVAGPFFKNSHQVFHDILAIFKRCKEVEKILKSSFFDDDEIAELISDLKFELRKEKTAKLARHVAQVYKYRNTSSCAENLSEAIEKNEEAVLSETENKAESENNEGESSQEAGAVGGEAEDRETQRIKKALIEYGTNIDDPIMQILFDTSLHNIISKRNENKSSAEKLQVDGNSSSDSCIVSAKGDGATDGSGVTDLNKKSVSDIIQTVIDSVCNNSDQELQEAFQALKQNMQLACDKMEKGEEVESGNQSTKEKTGLQESEAGKISQDVTQSTDLTGPQEDKSEVKALPPNHRTLCIRVCQALNVRLLHVKQEVNRKWLAYKFGCSENVTDFELFEKMQAKMIESLETGKGPLQINTGSVDVSASTECIKELESLEERRSSPDNIADEQTGETEEVAKSGENGDIVEKGFEVCAEASCSHRFKFQEQKPANLKSFMSAVRKEIFLKCRLLQNVYGEYVNPLAHRFKDFALYLQWTLLRTSLPDGIFVKVFEDRMDLLSVMVLGPEHTPYEDGLFVFDVQLPSDFPNSPPVFHYHSFCNERLNPNLYEDGKVCVSLLGTWSGKGNENWTTKSSVLQVLVSIQGLILVPEPYFNEAGYERQRGSQHGQENSRMYNEMAILKLIQSMTKMAVTPPAMFHDETRTHLRNHANRLIKRVENWVKISNESRLNGSSVSELELCSGSLDKMTESTEKPGSSISATSDSAVGLQEPEISKEEPARNGEPAQNKEKPKTDMEPVMNGEEKPRSKVKDSSSFEPDFPLLPASKGFCLTVRKHLECFKEVLQEHVFSTGT